MPKTTNKAKTINDDYIVNVKSLVSNLFYTCPRTNDSWVWEEVGDENEMTYGHLKTMKNQHKGFFNNKFVYIDDEDVVEKLGIANLYKTDVNSEDVTAAFKGNDVEEAKKQLLYISKDDIELLKEKVAASVESGDISNIKIIRLLEKELQIDLIDLV